jgi:hypothetical protein
MVCQLPQGVDESCTNNWPGLWVVVSGWGWRLLLMLFVDNVTHLLFILLAVKDGGGSFHFTRGYSCVCSLVQNLSSLATSSIQAPYKLRTSSVQVLF